MRLRRSCQIFFFPLPSTGKGKGSAGLRAGCFRLWPKQSVYLQELRVEDVGVGRRGAPGLTVWGLRGVGTWRLILCHPLPAPELALGPACCSSALLVGTLNYSGLSLSLCPVTLRGAMTQLAEKSLLVAPVAGSLSHPVTSGTRFNSLVLSFLIGRWGWGTIRASLTELTVAATFIHACYFCFPLSLQKYGWPLGVGRNVEGLGI